MRVYYQLGHLWRRDVQSMLKDRTGSGVILAPRHLERAVVEGLPAELRCGAIFDPQFFVPSYAKGKLSTYGFFPDNLSDGYVSSDFAGDLAHECAEQCVGFQVACDFQYVTVPTRHYPGVPDDFFEKQRDFSVQPFRAAYEAAGRPKGLLLQLVLNGSMLGSGDFRNEVLNWVTGMQDVCGIYLIFDVSPRSKQLDDPELLYQMMVFIRNLRDSGLEVVAGYLNAESLLLSLADPSVVTVGSWENVRMFRVATFASAEPAPNPPVPRIYVSRLLQFVDHRYGDALLAMLGPAYPLFDSNQYMDAMLDPDYVWWFNKKEPYFHCFLALCDQLAALGGLPCAERYQMLTKMILAAEERYHAIDGSGVALDKESLGYHLPAWRTAANRFAREAGWR